MRARIEYAVKAAHGTATRNGITVPVVTPYLDDAGKEHSRTLAIVPDFSVMLEPGTQVFSTHNGSDFTVTVGVAGNLPRAMSGTLRLELPQGWRSEPGQISINLQHRGEKQDSHFKVFPAALQPGRATIRAIFDSDGEKYSEGYTLVAREDLGSFYYYQPARQRVSIVDVKVPHDLKIGYIMGAGDDIPTIFEAIGNGRRRAGPATVQLSISLAAGHEDRILRVRGRGASAQLDFGRGIGWRDTIVRHNPLFDSYEIAVSTGRTLLRQARIDRARRLKSALAKQPGANEFEESMFRSIAAFYAGEVGKIDPRHDGRFATEVIRLCEGVTAAARAGQPSVLGVSVPIPNAAVRPTVLIVGGTGFIGRRVVRMLIERGHGVRVLTRNPRAAAIELGDLPVELFSGSHGDRESATRAVDGIEVVYHLAKCDGKRWQDYVEGDIEPTRILGEAALLARVKRFIYTGTIASYASGNPRTVIDNNTPIDSAIQRRNHYARSKGECEALLQSMQRDRGLPLVILRPAIVIGPGSPPSHPGVCRFESETKVDFWGDGTTPLPLVLVDDVADALVRALDAPGIEGQTLLLTSPPLLTAREYVNAVAAHMGTKIDARPRSAWRYWADDMVKELAKNVVRHPNRRWPSLHDSKCQAHRARYDSRMTEQALGWHPVADRATMIELGIVAAVQWCMR